MLRRCLLAAVLLAAPPALAEPERYEQVYLTHDQAIALALSGAERVVARNIVPTPEERATIQRALGRKLGEASYTFHQGLTGGVPTGYALILDEEGKYYPITFVVALTPAGAVADVAVMIYREKRGDAVKRRRFLDQFVGKTTDAPLMVNRDVTHLTGATVSSWAIAAGVKKAVTLYRVLGPRVRCP